MEIVIGNDFYLQDHVCFPTSAVHSNFAQASTLVGLERYSMLSNRETIKSKHPIMFSDLERRPTGS